MELERDIEIVKEAIHTKLWRRTEEQIPKWQTMLDRLCEHRNVGRIQLVLVPDALPMYVRNPDGTGKIILNKFSFISLLHEFAHHI